MMTTEHCEDSRNWALAILAVPFQAIATAMLWTIPREKQS